MKGALAKSLNKLRPKWLKRTIMILRPRKFRLQMATSTRWNKRAMLLWRARMRSWGWSRSRSHPVIRMNLSNTCSRDSRQLKTPSGSKTTSSNKRESSEKPSHASSSTKTKRWEMMLTRKGKTWMTRSQSIWIIRLNRPFRKQLRSKWELQMSKRKTKR